MLDWLKKKMRVCKKCSSSFTPIGIAQKYCSKCGIEHQKQKDWEYEHSKKCIEWRRKNDRSIQGKERYKRYRNTEKYRKYSQQRYWSVSENIRKAHYYVHNAIRDGKLVRPEFCEKCGIEDWGKKRTMIESHHYKGYEAEYWLTVQWLCTNCHKKAEKES